MPDGEPRPDDGRHDSSAEVWELLASLPRIETDQSFEERFWRDFESELGNEERIRQAATEKKKQRPVSLLRRLWRAEVVIPLAATIVVLVMLTVQLWRAPPVPRRQPGPVILAVARNMELYSKLGVVDHLDTLRRIEMLAGDGEMDRGRQ